MERAQTHGLLDFGRPVAVLLAFVLHFVSDDQTADHIVGTLLTEPLDRAGGRAVGAAVAALHFLHPSALEQTQELLAHDFLIELTPTQQLFLYLP